MKKENIKKESMKKDNISKNHSPIIKAFKGISNTRIRQIVKS